MGDMSRETIDAIRAYRDEHGCNLLDAKNAVLGNPSYNDLEAINAELLRALKKIDAATAPYAEEEECYSTASLVNRITCAAIKQATEQ